MRKPRNWSRPNRIAAAAGHERGGQLNTRSTSQLSTALRLGDEVPRPADTASGRPRAYSSRRPTGDRSVRPPARCAKQPSGRRRRQSGRRMLPDNLGHARSPAGQCRFHNPRSPSTSMAPAIRPLLPARECAKQKSHGRGRVGDTRVRTGKRMNCSGSSNLGVEIQRFVVGEAKLAVHDLDARSIRSPAGVKPTAK